MRYRNILYPLKSYDRIFFSRAIQDCGNNRIVSQSTTFSIVHTLLQGVPKFQPEILNSRNGKLQAPIFLSFTSKCEYYKKEIENQKTGTMMYNFPSFKISYSRWQFLKQKLEFPLDFIVQVKLMKSSLICQCDNECFQEIKQLKGNPYSRNIVEI